MPKGYKKDGSPANGFGRYGRPKDAKIFETVDDKKSGDMVYTKGDVNNFVWAWDRAKYKDKYFDKPFDTTLNIMTKKFGPINTDTTESLRKEFTNWYTDSDITKADTPLREQLLSSKELVIDNTSKSMAIKFRRIDKNAKRI